MKNHDKNLTEGELEGFRLKRNNLSHTYLVNLKICIFDVEGGLFEIPSAVIDTGCTQTIINENFLGFLHSDTGVNYKENLQNFDMMDAQGNAMHVKSGSVDAVYIEGVKFDNLKILFGPLGDVSALIGMDIIGQGLLTIDNNVMNFLKH